MANGRVGALGGVRAGKAQHQVLGHRDVAALPGRSHPHFLDKNRRDIGKSQSKWTAHTMENAPLTGIGQVSKPVASPEVIADWR
jgi:hypothetical protein